MKKKWRGQKLSTYSISPSRGIEDCNNSILCGVEEEIFMVQ